MYYKEVGARGGYGPDLLPIGGFWSSPKFQLWVCGKCGFTMWFVPPEYLEKVKEKFHEANVDPEGEILAFLKENAEKEAKG